MIGAFVAAKQKTVMLKHDCRKKLPVPVISVDHILCSHFLEHVFPEEMELILSVFSSFFEEWSDTACYCAGPRLTVQAFCGQ